MRSRGFGDTIGDLRDLQFWINQHGHADEFWAKALADLAAEQPISHLSDGVIVGTPRAVAWMPFALPAEF